MNSFFHFRSDWQTQSGPADVLVAFNAAYELDSKQLREIVDHEVQRLLRPDQLIIISRSTTISDAIDKLNDPQAKSTLLERLGEQCHVELWKLEADGRAKSMLILQPGKHHAKIDIEAIFRRGGNTIFNLHKGFVEGSDNYHFSNPSGKHTDRFIRLSNILVRQAEISFLGASLLRCVPLDTENIYIDTPALYAVVSALNDLRRDMPNCSYIAAENFRSYYGVESHPFARRERSVAIISASSSGGLQDKLIAAGFPKSRVVHLLFLGKVTERLEIAIDLAHSATVNPEGHDPSRRTYEENCELCASGSMFIELKGDQFDISPPQPRPLVVKQSHAPKSLSSLMERLSVAKAFATSAKDLHHVLPDALLKNKTYKQRLDYYLRRLVPSGAEFCILADEQSVKWGKQASAISGQTFKFVRADKADEISKHIKNGKTPILVIAAVTGSGRRLLDISRELRTAAPDAPVTYIAGFSKSVSDDARKTFKSSLTFVNRTPHHAFEAVEEIILPKSNRENAWARELSFLQEHLDKLDGESAAFASARIKLLQTTSAPMTNCLFVGNAESTPLKLRPGFAFWPTVNVKGTETQADVFTTISSVLQCLRTAPRSAKEEALRSGWFRQSLIHPEVFGRFNDGIIQGAFLRAALPVELDYRNAPEQSEMIACLIARIIQGAHVVRGEGAMEFLLALATGRLKLNKDHVIVALPPAPQTRPLVEGFRSLVQTKLTGQVGS